MTHKTLQLAHISACLTDHRPRTSAPGERGHAAVAMLLRENQCRTEALFMVRSQHDLDPWSGNIAFPGGRLNSQQEKPRQAAERETLEELAVDLSQADYLGQLDDLFGAIMPVLVSCFVYRLPHPVEIKPNHEVARTFWCPLQRLMEPARHRQKRFNYRGKQRVHPVVDLLGDDSPPLWGITYRLTRNFFSICGEQFGSSDDCR